MTSTASFSISTNVSTRRKTIVRSLTIVLGLTALLWSPFASAQAAQTPTNASPKKTIFVGIFESPEITGGAATGAGLSSMLTNALVNDGRFIVVERYALSDVQGEQQLGKQGSTTADTAPQSGQLIGARLLVRGTVTTYNPQASGGSLTANGPMNMFTGLSSSAGVTDTTAEVEIAVRLVDTTTGQIVYAGTATGSASTKGFNAQLYNNAGYGIGGSAFQSTPIGKACEDAINKLVGQLAIAAQRVQ
jgi:curli biogenesis system outer membrane secretion channel CsgG